MQRYKPLNQVPDEEDLALHRLRCMPAIMTERSHELVPFSKFVGGRVIDVSAEGGTAEIPLLVGPMNQNAIHLACNHYFLADWVMALGLFAALPGTTIVGFHDPHRSTQIQIWTRRAKIQHLSAGSETIRAHWRVEPEQQAKLREQLIDKGYTLASASVDVTQAGRVVSKISMDQAIFAIPPRKTDQSPSMIQGHQHNVSALLIAGLRSDPLSLAIAGQQGQALAERMSIALPQLPELVAARTQHLDMWLSSLSTPYQVLLLGAGLDTRPLRFGDRHQWFGVDLHTGVKFRRESFAREGLIDPMKMIPGDLRGDAWMPALADVGFDPAMPTVAVLEGVSMYIEADELARILRTLGSWFTHASSRVWLDHVSREVLDSPHMGIRAFLGDMARLGEPFITGFDHLEEVCASWTTERRRSSAEVLDIEDPLHHNYAFTIAARDA